MSAEASGDAVWRAECRLCDWLGEERTSSELASQDASAHVETTPDVEHLVCIKADARASDFRLDWQSGDNGDVARELLGFEEEE